MQYQKQNMQSYRIIVWSLLIFSFLSICCSRVNGAPRCTACNSPADCPPPQDCTYGIVKDYCGRDICAKGPGHRCGGKWNYLGTCGEGLICSCKRCGGCSLKTLECFSVTCI